MLVPSRVLGFLKPHPIKEADHDNLHDQCLSQAGSLSPPHFWRWASGLGWTLIIKNQTWDLGQVGNHPPDVKEGVGKEGLGQAKRGRGFVVKKRVNCNRHPDIRGSLVRGAAP